jgi:hypothetical protein
VKESLLFLRSKDPQDGHEVLEALSLILKAFNVSLREQVENTDETLELR